MCTYKNTNKCTNRQGRQFSFSPTPVPVRGLPPMTRSELRPMMAPQQPQQPASLPFQNSPGTNRCTNICTNKCTSVLISVHTCVLIYVLTGVQRFGFSPLRFPNSRPLQQASNPSPPAQLPSFFSPFAPRSGRISYLHSQHRKRQL